MALSASPQATPPLCSNVKPCCRKAGFSFLIFFIFFIFYMGTAIIQTPTFKDVAAAVFLNMPLGLFLSLMIFPVSWLLIFIYFKVGG